MSTALDIVSAVLLPTGALMCLLGAVGLLRFPDTLSRLHAASKPQTLGLLLILLGVAAQVPHTAPVLLVIGALQLVTAPVMSQFVARTAYRTGAVDRLDVDHLRDRQAEDEGADEDRV